MKDIDPSIFYKSKHNYRNLKNELARNIQKEILEDNEEYSTETKEALLEQIFPEMADYQGKNNYNFDQFIRKPSLQKKKLKKKQILKKMNSVGFPRIRRRPLFPADGELSQPDCLPYAPLCCSMSGSC